MVDRGFVKSGEQVNCGVHAHDVPAKFGLAFSHSANWGTFHASRVKCVGQELPPITKRAMTVVSFFRSSERTSALNSVAFVMRSTLVLWLIAGGSPRRDGPARSSVLPAT